MHLPAFSTSRHMAKEEILPTLLSLLSNLSRHLRIELQGFEHCCCLHPTPKRQIHCSAYMMKKILFSMKEVSVARTWRWRRTGEGRGKTWEGAVSHSSRASER